MVTRALVALAALLLSGAVAATCGVERAQDEVGASLVAVNALLDQREQALASGDRDAWMATVDPDAPQEFVDAQRRQFDGLRSVPVERFALVARDDQGDLAPEPDRVLPATRMTYRFTGFDDREAVDLLWLTYVRKGGRWFVASDTEVSDLGLDTARNLWDTGPVDTATTEHFLVLFHPEQRERAVALAGIAEDAAATLARVWDRPWLGRIPLVLPGSVDELEVLLQSTVDLDKFVAFVSYGTDRDETWAATAPRIYIQDRNLSVYGRESQVETLVHELAHAAGAALSGPFVPSWVHEGVADWLATGRRTDERKPRGSDGVLPRDHEFVSGPQDAILRSYAESRSAVSWLAATRGAGAPSALLAALGGPKSAPGSVDHHVDQALRSALGIGLADLQAGWAGR
jgi:hypothetical protein